MRVLCCLDGTNIEQLSNAVNTMLNPASLTLGLLYVIDSGPQEDLALHRERFLRGPHPPKHRHEQMREAEVASAQDILDESLRYLPGAELLQRSGRPEREIVQTAAEWNAGLIVICPRSPRISEPAIGPKSVGHVARFVLDHAPCPILLVRQHIKGLA